MQHNFELWIDESGSFSNEKKKAKKGWNPSCVGGALVEKGTIGENHLQSWLTNEVHCCEVVSKQQQFEYMEHLKQLETLKFVLIENKELIEFIDDNNTYYYMLAEGIIQVLKRLKGEYGEVHLDLVIATRVKEYQNIKHDEFIQYNKELDEKYLKQHLVLAGYRDGGITEKDWDVYPYKAKDNRKLQVADIICNSYLTRNTKMKDYAEIEAVFSDSEKTWIFQISQDVYKAAFSDMLSKGELGAAVIGICQSPKKVDINLGMKEIERRMEVYSEPILLLQMEYISLMLKYYINSMDKNKYIFLIENLKEYFLPVMKRSNNKSIEGMSKEFEFDLELHLLTVYTHKGNVSKEQEIIEKCDELIEKLPSTWENTETRLKYQNRKLIHFINIFDYEHAYKVFSEEKEKFKEIADFMSLINNEEVKYKEYAKFLGTGVQILQFKIRNEKDSYKEACALSDEAISAFSNLEDRKRQYQYRSAIETDIGSFDEAEKFIKNALDLEESASWKEIIKSVSKKENNQFILMNIFRLVAEEMLAKEQKGAEIFDVICSCKEINNLDKSELKDHPYEIILWKFATCWAEKGQLNAALEKYEKSVSLCFDNDDFTLWIIGLAILLEEYSYILRNLDKLNKKQKDVRKILERNLKKIQASNIPVSMKNIFGTIDFEEEKWEYFYELSRKITY